MVGSTEKLSYSFVDDQHRNTNMNDKDHLVGQLTRAQGERKVQEVRGEKRH